MYKITLAFFFFVNFCLAQNEQIIVNESKASFENKSYLIVEQLRLTDGFQIDASTDGSFFARVIGNTQNVPQSLDQNFLREEVVLKPGITTENQLAELEIEDVYRLYSYQDGIGRSLQSVAEAMGASRKDIIEPFTYDTKSRIDKSYISQEHSTSNGSYQSNAVSNLLSAYGSESPYSTYNYDDSPLDRVESVTGPGNDWRTNNKYTTAKFRLNNSNEVRKWEIVSGLPKSTAFYNANELRYSQSISEEGLITWEFVDSRGLTILSQQGRGGSWLDTYYVYNDLGRLLFLIPPEAAATTSPGSSYANLWYYQFKYDEHGNIIESKAPGTDVDWVYAVYDQYQRLVLVQDGVQRAKSPDEWSFFKYDDLNRVIMTGFISDNASRATMATRVLSSGTNPNRYENTANTSIGYTTNRTYPTSISESNLLTINYHDNYTFRSLPGWDAEGHSYNFINETEINEVRDEAVKGLATGSKVKILGTGQWLNSAIYYDDRYRPIQMISENHLGGQDILSIENDFAGRDVKQFYHHTGGESLTVLEEYEYDHAGRLLKTYHKVNNQPRILLCSLTYNERDEVVEKNVYSTNGGSSYLQSIDYTYNIRGWLEGMNSPLSTAENDLFGMQFMYNDISAAPSINGRSVEKKYDGNLSATIWERNHDNSNSIQKQAYSYEYNTYDRLDRANYANESGGFTGEGGKLDLRAVVYDKNGNIKTLDRYENVSGTGARIDQLVYQHDGNQLKTVNDSESDLGFGEGIADQATKEYYYDENGNVMEDLNNEIIDIDYNYLDLPKRIEFDNGLVIEYTYDAAGTKLKKRVTKGGSTLSEIDYAGGVQYEDNNLAFVYTSQGRAINKIDQFEYEFFYKDHLGNTRLTYGMLSEVEVFKATMENPLATEEESEFLNLATSRSSSTTNNHTNASPKVPNPDRTAYLFGGINVGPAKVLTVKNGDHVDLSVFARYDIPTGGNTGTLPGWVGAVTNALNIAATGETQLIYDAFDTWLPGFVNTIPNSGTTPKAYLNYILFPADYQGTPQFGYVPVTLDGYASWEHLELEVAVPFDGFMYVYVANESTVGDCSFDDFRIIHDKSEVSLQISSAIDYYPYGMEIASTKYINEGVLLNRATFQSDYSEKDEYTEWQSFELRGNYDPRLGTWYSSDPYGQYGSPYVGMGNNPVNGVDPDGGLFGLSAAGSAAAGAFIGGFAGALVGTLVDDNFDENMHLWIGGGALLGGAFGYWHGNRIVKPVRTPRFMYGDGKPSPSKDSPSTDIPDPEDAVGTTEVGEALIDRGDGKLVPASDVEVLTETTYTYEDIITKQPTGFSLPLDASKEALANVARGFAYASYLINGRLSSAETRKWYPLIDRSKDISKELASRNAGIRMTDLFDFKALRNVASGPLSIRQEGYWEHLSGRGNGVFRLNKDGVEIMLQEVSFWPIADVSVRGRKITMFGKNPHSGGFNKIGHIKFKKSQEALFRKVLKIMGR
ncbi:MAG: DUF6443 domain-containing protein [Bacteroidota bacterium]